MTDSLRRLTLPGYLVAALFVILPVADVVTQVWPWDPSSEQWRFGLVAVLSTYLSSAVFGLLAVGLVAAASGHRFLLRGVGVLAGLGALILAAACLAFILDTLQLRQVVREEQREVFRIGAGKTLFKVAVSAAVLLVMSPAAFKAAGALADAGAKDHQSRGVAPLVVRDS